MKKTYLLGLVGSMKKNLGIYLVHGVKSLRGVMMSKLIFIVIIRLWKRDFSLFELKYNFW